MQLFDSDLGKYTFESNFKYQNELWYVSYLLRPRTVEFMYHIKCVSSRVVMFVLE